MHETSSLLHVLQTFLKTAFHIFALIYLNHHPIEHFSFSTFINTAWRNIFVHTAFSLRFKLLVFSLELEPLYLFSTVLYLISLLLMEIMCRLSGQSLLPWILCTFYLRCMCECIFRVDIQKWNCCVKEVCVFKILTTCQISLPKSLLVYISAVYAPTNNCDHQPFYCLSII